MSPLETLRIGVSKEIRSSIRRMAKRFTPRGNFTSVHSRSPSSSLSTSSPACLRCFALAGDKHPLTFQLSYYFYPARVTGHKGSLSIESTLSVQLSSSPAARTIAKPRSCSTTQHPPWTPPAPNDDGHLCTLVGCSAVRPVESFFIFLA